MLNEKEVKFLGESMVEAAQVGTLNALTCIKKGLEALKTLEIPIADKDGNVKEYSKPTPEQMIEYMIIYIDETIKMIESKNSSK